MKRSCAALLLPAVALAAPPPFTAAGVAQWQPQRFDGKAATNYVLRQDGAEHWLAADCDSAASGLIWHGRIELAKTPILQWRWRLRTRPTVGDERQRAGDDFAARIYVVRDGGWAVWRTRSLVYVWAAQAEAGEAFPNAYTDQAQIVVLRGSGDAPGQWQRERRDLHADFQRYFDIAPQTLDAIALMTDCDDSGSRAAADYAEIELGAP